MKKTSGAVGYEKMGEVKKKERQKLKEEERGEKRKRVEDKDEYETVMVKRRCERCFFLLRPLKLVSQGGDFESCVDLSWDALLGEPDDLSDRELVSCELVRVVPDVADVLVSPSSVVTEVCEVCPVALIGRCCTATFFFLQEACTLFSDKQEEMRYESSPVKARRRMTPPTPMHNS